VAPAPDRNRVAVRRRVDTDRDGLYEAEEDDGIYILDLARGVEGRTIPAKGITSVDWSSSDDVLVYSARGEGGLEDLYSAFVDGSLDGNRTLTPSVRERRFRFDPSARILAFERSLPGERSEIWLYQNLQAQLKLTSGDTSAASTVLPGTHFLLGSDTDPDISPDFSAVVFRRLTGLGESGRGTWDILTVDIGTSEVKTIATGPAYRSAPDWGPRGIVYSETAVGGTTAGLVVVDAFGNKRTAYTQAASFVIESPRWLP
jgi:Tol biopolymer transport system component